MTDCEKFALRIELRDVYTTRLTVAPWVRRTPLKLSRANVHLKLETVHDTGAFKIRGATNCILNLSDEERARGVVTVSTGNHGRAVAYAAKRLGIRVHDSSKKPIGRPP